MTITSVLKCTKHDRQGVLVFDPPAYTTDTILFGRWFASYDMGGAMYGVGFPNLPCVSDPECLEPLEFWFPHQ